jgi:hypothetical protein
MKQVIYAIVDKKGDIVYNAMTLSGFCAGHDAWCKFFRHNPHQVPLGEAKKAYEAIGYRCAKFELTEIPMGEKKDGRKSDE